MNKETLTMTRQAFFKLVNILIEQEKRDRELSQALNKYAASEGKGDECEFRCDWLSDDILSIIEDVVGLPASNYVVWWIYGSPNAGEASYDDCTVTADGKKWCIKTMDDLYDFLTDEVMSGNIVESDGV